MEKQYYVINIQGDNITLSTRRGMTEVFKRDEVGLLATQGVLIDKVTLNRNGVSCNIHNRNIDLVGELYVECYHKNDLSRVIIRNIVTGKRSIWKLQDIRWFLQNIGPIYGVYFDKDDRNALSFRCDVKGVNQETARFDLVTGLHGLIFNNTMYKVYAPSEGYKLTPGDYCDTIVSNALVVKSLSREITVVFDSRIKSVDSEWIHGDSSVVTAIVTPDMSDSVLENLYLSNCRVDGLDDRDHNYYMFVRMLLNGGVGMTPKFDTLDRFTAKFKPAMIKELNKNSNFLDRNASVVDHLLRAAESGRLSDIVIDLLTAPFSTFLITPYYIKAGGSDKEILDLYIERVRRGRV